MTDTEKYKKIINKVYEKIERTRNNSTSARFFKGDAFWWYNPETEKFLASKRRNTHEKIGVCIVHTVNGVVKSHPFLHNSQEKHRL